MYVFLNTVYSSEVVKWNLDFTTQQPWLKIQASPFTCTFFPPFNLGQIFLISLNFRFLIC